MFLKEKFKNNHNIIMYGHVKGLYILSWDPDPHFISKVGSGFASFQKPCVCVVAGGVIECGYL